MSYEDWRDMFSTVFINIDFPERWTGVRFNAQWHTDNSPGLPTSVRGFKEYAKNPQFLIKANQDTEVFFSLTQSGGRQPLILNPANPDHKTYFNYPFEETLNYANVCVFELDYGEKDFLRGFDKKKLKFCSPIKRERENAGTIKINQGKSYIVVPSTEKAGQTGNFFLSIYIDNDLKDVDITRVYPDG